MRVLVLPSVAELGDGALLALRNEHRVVAEAAAAARAAGNRPVEDAGAAQLLPVRRDRDELTDVARAAVVDVAQLLQQLCDRRRALRCVARGVNAGPAAERCHLDARVLADRPAAGTPVREPRLDQRVLVVRRPRLLRIVVGVERRDRPAREQHLQLTRLVCVPRRKRRGHSIQRTSSTPSISATAATTCGEPWLWSATSIAISRRSPSCATSSETTRP